MSLAAAAAAAIATYNLSEVSGDAVAQTGGIDLLGHGGIGSTTGKFGLARVFAAGKYFDMTDAIFEIDDTDWFATIWAFIPTGVSSNGCILTKSNSSSGSYFLTYRIATGFMEWEVYSASGFGGKTSVLSGPVSLDGWRLICIKHSATNNLIGISLDGGAFTTASHSAGVYDGSLLFELGLDAFSNQLSGNLDDLVIGKGYEFTDADAAALWNSGTGVAFSSWAGGGGGSPVTVTPGVASLTITRFAPTVSTPRLVTPGVRSLALSTFAPTVSTPRLIAPGVRSLSLSAFAPIASTPRLVTPGKLSLTLSSFAPTVLTPRVVTPGTLALSITRYAPGVTGGQGKTVIPGTRSLSLSTFAPTVTAGGAVTVAPGARALVLTLYAPAVAGSTTYDPLVFTVTRTFESRTKSRSMSGRTKSRTLSR